MLAFLADTHGTANPGLRGRTAEAVADASLVCHAGDFTTPAVYEAIDHAAGDGEAPIAAVQGNSDAAALRERLPRVRTVDALERRFLLVHGHEHDRTSLPLLARQEGADCVVVGHTHRPGIEDLGEVTVVNPGSHADPRGGPATHAEGRRVSGGVAVAVVTASGEQWAVGRV